jgi:hypothetical protein
MEVRQVWDIRQADDLPVTMRRERTVHGVETELVTETRRRPARVGAAPTEA